MTTHTPSLSERLADQIVDLIRADGLDPGEPLAASRDLAKRFDVTTPTLREALRRLEAVDVIRFRHGSGTYVGEGIRRRFLPNPHLGSADRASILELVDARLLLEPAIAARAATSRTDRQLAVLEGATGNALVPQRGAERPRLHFHVALADASGNPLVRDTVEALLAVRSQEQIEIRHTYDDRDRDHAEHVRIVEAVRDRDPVAAADLTRTHLESIRAAMAASTGEDAR